MHSSNFEYLFDKLTDGWADKTSFILTILVKLSPLWEFSLPTPSASFSPLHLPSLFSVVRAIEAKHTSDIILMNRTIS